MIGIIIISHSLIHWVHYAIVCIHQHGYLLLKELATIIDYCGIESSFDKWIQS